MKTIESILERRSVRTYTGEALDEATAGNIAGYIAGLKAPFGAVCRIAIVRSAASAEPVKLGTYGAIRGATDFLALIVRDEGQLAQEGAAYVFEQAILYCTSLGLGTCWLAGFFDRGNFRKQLALQPGEKLRCVSPVGYASDKPHRSLSTLMSGGKPTTRKPFSETFFLGGFDRPLSEEQAGIYARPLEMVRRAPSANNKQTWRVVLDESADTAGVLHFYKMPSMGYESLDMGIALCHFEQTCRELGIAGHFEILPGAPQGKKAVYAVSWIGNIEG